MDGCRLGCKITPTGHTTGAQYYVSDNVNITCVESEEVSQPVFVKEGEFVGYKYGDGACEVMYQDPMTEAICELRGEHGGFDTEWIE